MSEGRRTVWARLGIVALNLLQPGLGLLRLGRLRLALLCLFGPLVAYALVVAWYAAGPTITLAGYFISGALLLLLALAAYIVSIVLSWRWSKVRSPQSSWWSRWYGIAGAALALIGFSWAATPLAHSFYKPFYLPAEGMAPTLEKGDRVIASMRPPEALHRGDIVIVAVRDTHYVKRIAALPGDRIAMKDGIVVLNGRPVPQRLLRVDRLADEWEPVEARRLEERLPGEARPHQIYDLGPERFDDMPEQRVAPGHIFVLGDNRDRTADSRVPPDQMGVGQLPVAKVRGRVLFQTWNPDGRIGRPIG